MQVVVNSEHKVAQIKTEKEVASRVYESRARYKWNCNEQAVQRYVNFWAFLHALFFFEQIENTPALVKANCCQTVRQNEIHRNIMNPVVYSRTDPKPLISCIKSQIEAQSGSAKLENYGWVVFFNACLRDKQEHE